MSAADPVTQIAELRAEALAALEAATAEFNDATARRDRARQAYLNAGRQARAVGVTMDRVAKAMGQNPSSAHRALRERT